MLHCDPPETESHIYSKHLFWQTQPTPRFPGRLNQLQECVTISPGFKDPLSVGGSNRFRDNIPSQVHLFSALFGKGWARVGSGRVGFRGESVSAAAHFLHLGRLTSATPSSHCLQSSATIHLSFPEALSALVSSTMGNAGGPLSGEGRQQDCGNFSPSAGNTHKDKITHFPRF